MMYILKQAFNSPALMTWGNLSAKSSSLVILLPVVLTTFSAEDIVIWYLYFTVVSLQMLIDLGFLPTFTRLFSYAYSGLSIEEIYKIKSLRKKNKKKPDQKSLYCLFLATRHVYSILAVLSLILSLTAGSWFVAPILAKSSNPSEAWAGWLIVCVLASFNLFANSFVALLTGMDKVALVQRWQMLTSLMSVITSSLVILFSHSLLAGISVYFSWYIFNFIINFYLLKKNFQYSGGGEHDKVFDTVKRLIFPTAWRSGLGVLFSMGLIQISGVVVARFEDQVIAASYMIGLQIIRAISSFSQVPFYSRIPYFSQLYARKQITELIRLTKDRMLKSLMIFCIMYTLVAFLGDVILNFINAKADFPELKLWLLIGLAFFIERFGVMLLQLYTLSNHIVWHIANGITGSLMIILVFFFHSFLGVLSFPLAMVVAYVLFFIPYVVTKFHSEFNIKDYFGSSSC